MRLRNLQIGSNSKDTGTCRYLLGLLASSLFQDKATLPILAQFLPGPENLTLISQSFPRGSAGMLRSPHLLSSLWNVLAQCLMGEWEEVPEDQALVSLPKCLKEHMEESGILASGDLD